MRSLIPILRNHVLRHAARILVKSGTFRRHLGALDPNLDPDFRCVFRASGERIKFAATKYRELGTLLGFESTDGHREARGEHRIIEVETVSLDDLLEQHGAPRDIDYISVDTEGSELEILEH